MNTTFLLMAQYSKPIVQLKEIAEEYLGLTPREAQREANMNRLPIPTFRLRDSQKAPLMIHIKDLATHIDTTLAVARVQWNKSQI
ncbi:pyocin activator PrtN family protein [Janthinobacterium sp. B9-8]|uniref:pyocin activator PrtN family protein n=1 Tax=Janthinobacterium sp. B9-8 TaxID=1236179 RepID=UPI00061D0516|nr:pyocin activator PrtN family protein [Janthinobacterium sp. B9-8]AMC33141.1 pyocin activator protein PrtN [Janthinobacterium sp. B9-8]